MKQEFIEFLESLMNAAPEVVKEKMTDGIKQYIEILKEQKNEVKPILTDKGIMILKYLQESQIISFKATDVGEAIGMTGRQVAGSLRKMITDGFCEKVGENPIVYALTEKGKNYNLKENNNEEN